MSNSTSTEQEKNEISPVENVAEKVTPLRCLLGAFISGGLTYGMYSLTAAIIGTYGSKPIASKNQLAINIASAVRTLVMGVSTLATFIFAFVTVGLILLAIQLTFQGLRKTEE